MKEEEGEADDKGDDADKKKLNPSLRIPLPLGKPRKIRLRVADSSFVSA